MNNNQMPGEHSVLGSLLQQLMWKQ